MLRKSRTGELLIHFCETFNLFLCNARQKTTRTGHRKDKTTGTVVPIYNQIDYILSKQIHRQVLTGAHSYNGGHTTSDHRILVSRFKLPRMFRTFSTSQKSKLERFAVERLKTKEFSTHSSTTCQESRKICGYELNIRRMR